MKITVFGLGYVGSTLAVLLSRQHDVFVLDKNEQLVDAIRNDRSPIGDAKMEECLQKEALNLFTPKEVAEAVDGADYIFIATNTQLDPEAGILDISSIHRVMESVISSYDKSAPPVIVVKSTVPTGFTEDLKRRYPEFDFLFCPEFLREKTAMEDVLNPSRIIVGYDETSTNGKSAAEKLGAAILSCVDDSSTPLLYTSIPEAESIKLFANSYLALRLSFFNELDTFATVRGLDSSLIIKGVCLDPRIGDYYNVPGPGFGGKCLPKDTRQLIADFDNAEVPELVIRAAVEENELRKEFVAEQES
ncbi:MAG: UDP-glucose/GDP-mannose dehydrogenase family protein [Mogibacterium sp.]|nr:UDP-glucose/GDP-mannose dehydrogenase family protein [Mogibacterium sp.]